MIETQNSQTQKENTKTIDKLQELQEESYQNESKEKMLAQMKRKEEGETQGNDRDDEEEKDNVIANIDSQQNDKDNSNQPQYFKQVEMQIVPILRHLKTNCVYMLSGDVMVDLDLGSYIYPKNNSDRASCCEISELNSFKNPIRVVVFAGQSEVEMTISQQGLGDFRKIIEILSNYPEQRAHNFGIILSKYQQYVDCQQKKAAFLAKDASFQQIVPSLDQAFHDFLDESRNYLKNEFSIQNKFFFQLIVRPNVQTFTNDIARAGISEQLCQLLGGSPKQIGSLILRRGIFEFFSKSARNNFYFSYLSLFLNIPLEGIDDQVSLITLDGIEVTVKFQMMNYYGKKPSPNVLFYHPYTMIIISFDVPPEILAQVAEIRRTSLNTNNLIQEFGQDIYYSLESQIFLESFYADQLHRIDLNNGQPLPPVKRKYKKHKLSKNSLGFRVQAALAEGNKKMIRKNTNIQESSEAEDSSRPSLNALPLNKKYISKMKGNSRKAELDQSEQMNGENYEEIYQANSENTIPSVSAQQNQLSSQITVNTCQ